MGGGAVSQVVEDRPQLVCGGRPHRRRLKITVASVGGGGEPHRRWLKINRSC